MNHHPIEDPEHAAARSGPALRVVPGARPETHDFRSAITGAVVGFFLVGGSVFGGALLAGAGVGTCLGVGVWLGFWGGGGFGFMLGAAVPRRSRKRPAG